MHTREERRSLKYQQKDVEGMKDRSRLAKRIRRRPTPTDAPTVVIGCVNIYVNAEQVAQLNVNPGQIVNR